MKISGKSEPEIKELAEKLVSGELIVIPTETVYGLATNALNIESVGNIFKVKGRPQDNPLIVHTHSAENIYKYTNNQPKYIDKLIERFMPGPLTLVLDKSELIPSLVSAGLNTIGIRIPDNELTLSLLKEADVPVAAPSANKSGRPSPTKVQHIIDDYGIENEDIYACLDGGECSVGIESTIIRCGFDKIEILRPGIISKDKIHDLLDIEVVEYMGTDIISPGMKYKHYSPKIPVRLSEDIIENDKILNLFYGIKILNLKNAVLIDEKNLYDIYRNAEKLGYQGINIVVNDKLRQNKGLFNRISKSVEK